MICILNKLFPKKDDAPLRNAIAQNPIFVDVRTHQEFLSGSIPNAVNIPLQNLGNQVDGLDRQSIIVIFCKSGMRSKNAFNLLSNLGFEHVFNGGSLSNIRDLVENQHAS